MPTRLRPRRGGFFPDTAYWNPTLRTGSDGTVTVRLTVPDSLTTWAGLARAVTLETLAAQGRAEIVVTKPIIADPALPRFAVQGDHFALDVLARNYVGGNLDANCVLETPGLVQLDPGNRTLNLPFNTTEVARWSVVASELGTNTVSARVSTSAGEDAIELPLEVVPFSVPERFLSTGATDTTSRDTFHVPYHAIPESSRVEVRLAPAMALGVLDGLEDLIGFPYGCVEQTMSRVLPNAVVDRLLLELDLNIPEITEQLPPMIALGLQKLYGFQNTDGSWGWWHGDGNVHTTAYVLFGLATVQDAGTLVDPQVLDRGFVWLTNHLAGETDPRIRAYGAYVLAVGGRELGSAVLTDLAARPDLLDSFGVAALAQAAAAAGLDTVAAALLDNLESRAVVGPTSAHWPLVLSAPNRWEPYHWQSMASAEKNTGLALQTLARLRPDSELAPKAARWLLENRWGRGWRTTQATAYAVLGLTDYIVASGELESQYDWRVLYDDTEVAAGQVNRSNILNRLDPIVIDGADLSSGDHVVTIEKSGQGTLYHTLFGQLALYHDGFAATSPAELGIAMGREYVPVERATGGNTWRVGDLINVKLTVRVEEDLWYVLVEDMLPAGLEALNEGLDTERSRTPKDENTRWRWWGYERKEVHDEKVTFFATYLHAGEHVFEYAARAVTPGVFSARPGEAYAMYRPEAWGRTASARISISPEAVEPRPPLSSDFDRDCRVTEFDTALAAEAWGQRLHRDANRDGQQDVIDIAVARGAEGESCGAGQAPAGENAGGLDLTVRTQPADGGGTVVELWAAPRGAVSDLATFEALLDLGGAVTGASVGEGNVIGFPWMFGPLVTDSAVRLGLAGSGAALESDRLVATLHVDARLDAGDIVIKEAVASDARGGRYRVAIDGADLTPRPNGHLFLPLVQQR
jgi:alpha-2-macroglobulin